MAHSTAYEQYPDHAVVVEPAGARIRVIWRGYVVAESVDAKRVLETGHEPVVYVPLQDVVESRLLRSEHTTHCPFKGDATYFALRSRECTDADAAWVYEDPYDQVEPIRDHMAFVSTLVAVESTPLASEEG